MHKGEVVYCPKYKFDNGGESDKLIINLNNPLAGEPYVVLLVTSQQKFRINRSGCFSVEGYYVISKGEDFFDKDFTWVLFNTVKEFELKEELRESWKGNFITVGHLKTTTISAIINCFKRSNFITKYQESLLRIEERFSQVEKPPLEIDNI
jgi:hypothetical protein